MTTQEITGCKCSRCEPRTARRSNPVTTRRVMILGGELVGSIGLSNADGSGEIDGTRLMYPLFDAETGARATASYHGQASVDDAGASLVLGDPQYTANLVEHRIGPPTPESVERRDWIERGYKAARVPSEKVRQTWTSEQHAWFADGYEQRHGRSPWASRRPRRANPAPDYAYLGQCDKLRRGSPRGEAAWQAMIAEAAPISREAFLAKADLGPVLDEDETGEEWTGALDEPRYWASRWEGKPAVFVDSAGFEFIFVKGHSGACNVRLSNPAPAVVEDALEKELPYSAARAEACRKKNQGSKFIRPGLRHAIYKRDNYRCAYCGFQDPYGIGGNWYAPDPTGNTVIAGRRVVRVGITVDHVVACALGGSNKPTNLVTVCNSCNSAKQHKTRWQWYAYLAERHAYDEAHIAEIRREVRNRLRRALDRKEGLALAERAEEARKLAREKPNAKKWGLGRERLNNPADPVCCKEDDR